MKASELVEQLQAAIAEYGDLEVGVLIDECGVYGELEPVSGLRTARRGNAFWNTDDETLGDQFIALG